VGSAVAVAVAVGSGVGSAVAVAVGNGVGVAAVSARVVSGATGSVGSANVQLLPTSQRPRDSTKQSSRGGVQIDMGSPRR
jgi:hypothetical protein